MNGKKYENVMDSEAEFKAFMKSYEDEMYRLRSIHQRIVKDKGYNVEGETPTINIDKELSIAKENSAREELKSRESETKSNVSNKDVFIDVNK